MIGQNNVEGLWLNITNLYIPPSCGKNICSKAGAKSLGIGGSKSGVSFHSHGFGFSEVIIGTFEIDTLRFLTRARFRSKVINENMISEKRTYENETCFVLFS